MFADFARSIDLRADYWGPLTIILASLLALALLGRALSVVRWRTHLIILLGLTALVALSAYLTNNVWHPVADAIGAPTWLWSGYALWVVIYAVLAARAHWPQRGRLRPTLSVLTAALAVGLGFALTGLGINAYYGGYPTLASALGITVPTSTLAETGASTPVAVYDTGGQTLASTWTAPANLASEGTIIRENIPAHDSAFTPRDAYIYLPPAYFSNPRPLLPVVVLMAGQPGSPSDWFNLGQVHTILDSYAADQAGLAPVVVVVDQLGGDWTNPLCSDTAHGQVATYLQETVPTWLTSNLQVDTDRSHWAIAGLSNGGTCALQTALRAPDTYPAFINMSGEAHPSLGNEKLTLTRGFDGDQATYQANDPATMLEQGTYTQPGPSGIFSIGTEDDPSYTSGLEGLYTAAQQAGLNVQWKTYPGKHEWKVWEAAFADALPWLGQRTGLQ
ncbi:alpha/beta hydrolase [Rothia sp. 88186D007BW]